MFKGYRNHLFYKNNTNKTVALLPQVAKCSKCKKNNPITVSPAASNIHICCYCGQPFFVIN